MYCFGWQKCYPSILKLDQQDLEGGQINILLGAVKKRQTTGFRLFFGNCSETLKTRRGTKKCTIPRKRGVVWPDLLIMRLSGIISTNLVLVEREDISFGASFFQQTFQTTQKNVCQCNNHMNRSDTTPRRQLHVKQHSKQNIRG